MKLDRHRSSMRRGAWTDTVPPGEGHIMCRRAQCPRGPTAPQRRIERLARYVGSRRGGGRATVTGVSCKPVGATRTNRYAAPTMNGERFVVDRFASRASGAVVVCPKMTSQQFAASRLGPSGGSVSAFGGQQHAARTTHPDAGLIVDAPPPSPPIDAPPPPIDAPPPPPPPPASSTLLSPEGRRHSPLTASSSASRLQSLTATTSSTTLHRCSFAVKPASSTALIASLAMLSRPS